MYFPSFSSNRPNVFHTTDVRYTSTMDSLAQAGFSIVMVRVYLILLIIAAAAYTIYLKVYKKSEKFMRLALQVPGPRRYPVIGTTYYYGTNTTDIFQSIFKISDNFGPVSGHWFGPEFVAVINKATDIEKILSSTVLISKPFIYRIIEPLLGLGLATSSGDRWRKHRKLITPTFHYKVLEDYIEVFNSKVKCLVKTLESEVNNLDFDIEHYFEIYAFDLICATAMSSDVNFQTKMEGDITFYEACSKGTVTAMQRIVSPWLYKDVLFNISSIGKLQNKCVEVIQKCTSQIIARKKEILRNNKPTEEREPENDAYGKRKMAFLDYLLSYQAEVDSNFSDKDIEDEVKTFLLTGYDSTVISLGLISYELSHRFDVQEQIVLEIKEVFGSLDDKPFTNNDLQKLKYLERVIKECLRLHTTVPFIAREITEDVELPSGYTLPKGSSAIIAFCLLHMDPESFPNPTEFNPDNFLPQRIAERHPYSYCLFSAGPRNCIGQKYAMLQLKASILSIVRRYWLLPTKVELKLAAEITLRSKTGIHVGLKERTEERPLI